MPLYKSAQLIDNENYADDIQYSDDLSYADDVEFADDDQVVIYDELPSKEDVIEMHEPEAVSEEVHSFKLPHLPGCDKEDIEVSEDEPMSAANDNKEVPAKELEVKDPWDWHSHGLDNFIGWVKGMFNNIPRHSGETVGIERVIAYLKRMNNELSKAVSNDYDGKIDVASVEAARKEIYSAIDRLEEARDKQDQSRTSAKKKKTANSENNEIVKEAKQTAVGGIIITVPLLISRIAKVCINGMVSGGHDIEELYDRQVKEYDLTKREQSELMELLDNMGFAMPRRDRGYPREHKMDYRSSDNMDFGANYSA